MTKATRTVTIWTAAAVGALVVLAAFASKPPAGPKPVTFVAGLHLGVALLLFALGVSNAPVVEAAPTRSVADPPTGPAPPPRWHRVVLTHREPDRVDVRAPERCPTCGAPGVDWWVPIATQERNAGMGAVLGVAGGPVGELVARALVKTRQVVVGVCDPCHRLATRRDASRVVALTVALVPTVVASFAALLERLSWPVVAAGSVALAGGALAVHLARFARRRARAGSLVGGLGVRARVRRATWLALSETSCRWSIVLDACDPVWAREVAELNADACDADLDLAALEAHAAELRSLGLR